MIKKLLRPESPAARRGFLKKLATLPALPAMIAAEPALTGSAQQPANDNRQFHDVIGYKLEQHIRESRFAILPLGSVEYHGPSGPASTDSILATGIAARLAPKFNASVFPPIHFTHCPAHTASFKGTVSVRPEVMAMYFADVLRGIVANGFKKVFILNGHSGNIGSAREAISQVTHEFKDTNMLMANWWETLTISTVESLKIFTSGNGGRGHGGPLEMSSAAVFAPNSVEAGRAPDLPPTDRPLEGLSFYLEKSATPDWPGYSGKLSEISRERGERLVEIATKRIEELIEYWLKNETKAGNW